MKKLILTAGLLFSSLTFANTLTLTSGKNIDVNSIPSEVKTVQCESKLDVSKIRVCVIPTIHGANPDYVRVDIVSNNIKNDTIDATEAKFYVSSKKDAEALVQSLRVNGYCL
ncbi:MAG: hypothetical protein U0T83_06030 [Bacteriovoracaceae bacterium]